jgi:BirA family biotin operon repressor/biotin-[acetyl-CoA-carboxylase] ligase
LKEIKLKLEIHHFESLESTQTLAHTYANAGASEGTVIIADSQTAGKGRMGRVWQSPVGNLLTSLILRPSVHKNAPPPSAYGQIALMIGVAVRDSIEKYIHNAPSVLSLKWPNDGLIDGKKVFGVLVECVDDAVVVGIGVNVNTMPQVEDRPVTTLKAHATAKEQQSIPDLEITEIFHDLLKHVFKFYKLWLAGDFETIRQSWMKTAFAINEPVIRQIEKSELTEIPEDISGIFRGIAASGAMLLEKSDGTMAEIYSLPRHLH